MSFDDNETVDGTEQSHESSQDNAGSELKSELQALKNQNAELLQKMSSFLQPKEEKKTMSPEEYKSLLDKDPQAAIEYALESKINAKTLKIEQALTSKQQSVYFDQKAEVDFPLLKNDKQFQSIVSQETKSLIEDGMSKDSPKLIYKAAQIAALKYKGAQDTKDSETRTMSGEAPNNISKTAPKKNLPKNFDRLAEIFGANDKVRKRAEENYRIAAEKKTRG